MSDKDWQPTFLLRPNRSDGFATEQVVQLMSRELVFTMQFLGESQRRLHVYFQAFITRELAAAGITQETHPMLHLFIEQHALLMRNFIFSGVALSRQFRIGEIEWLIGDTRSLLRVDIWDRLKSHIELAQRQFQQQAPNLPALLVDLAAPGKTSGGAP